MRLSNSERLLESLPPEPRGSDELFAFKDAAAQSKSKPWEEYSEEQIRSAMESVLEPIYEARRKQRELLDAAILRTACKKYAAITGKHAVDLTNGIPEIFRAVYDSVVNALSVELFEQPSEDIRKMAARLSVGDWGTI